MGNGGMRSCISEHDHGDLQHDISDYTDPHVTHVDQTST